MADHNIRVKVSQDTSRGAGFQKNQLEQAKALQSIRQTAEKNGVTGFQNTSQKELNKNLKALIKLQSEQIQMSKRAGFGKSGGGRGAAIGGAAAAGGGAGIGSVGASMPYIGAAIALGGFAVNQILKVGKAHIAKVAEQQGSMGLAGKQYGETGDLAYYNAAQMGEYQKSRIMASGDFGAGGGDNFAMRYAKRFGLGAGEVGKQLGLMDMATGGRGGKTMDRILATAHISDKNTKRGQNTIGSELPLMVGAISQALEEAVKNGMDASSIASDMAGEIAHISKYSQNGSIQGTIAGIQALSATQTQVGQGSIGGSMQNWGMYQAGEKFIQKEFAKGTDSKYVQKLIDNSIVSKAEVARYQKNGMSFSEKKYFAERVNSENNPELRDMFNKSIMTTFGTKNYGKAKHRADTKEYLRGLGYDTTNFDARYNSVGGIETRVGKVTGAEVKGAEAAMAKATAKTAGKDGFRAIELANMRENLLLHSSAAKKAAEGVERFETALIDAAISMEGMVNDAVDYMTGKKTISGGIKGLGQQIGDWWDSW